MHVGAYMGSIIGPGHNLAQMASALPEGHPWIETIRSLDKHSPAATRYRYPTTTGRLWDPPDAQRLQEDVDELTELLKEAGQFLAPDDQGESSPIIATSTAEASLTAGVRMKVGMPL